MFHAVDVQSHGMGHRRTEDNDMEYVARYWDREYESGRYENGMSITVRRHHSRYAVQTKLNGQTSRTNARYCP